MTGVELIAEERKRQIEQEGWIAEHDDLHEDGELASAAACYAMTERNRQEELLHSDPHMAGYFKVIDAMWPFHTDWWKPKDRVRDLVRAGALIAAEIDRLQRKAARPGGE